MQLIQLRFPFLHDPKASDHHRSCVRTYAYSPLHPAFALSCADSDDASHRLRRDPATPAGVVIQVVEYRLGVPQPG